VGFTVEFEFATTSAAGELGAPDRPSAAARGAACGGRAATSFLIRGHLLDRRNQSGSRPNGIDGFDFAA
jgi:hypothetical protein